MVPAWFLLIFVASLLLRPGEALAQPDFVHAGTPHVMGKNAFALPSQLDQYEYLKPRSGTRPLMVILLEFPDSHHYASYTPAYYENRVFGADPSVNGYFQEVSYGDFSFSNAGVVGWFEAADSAATYYFGPTSTDQHYTELGAAAVQAAVDHGVDFTPFDTDGDGEVTRDELLVLMVFASHPSLNLPYVMATRFDQQASIGVVTPGGLEIDTWAVRAEQNSAVSLMAHELAHGALALPDLYGDDYGGDDAGIYTLMSVVSSTFIPHFSAWAKLHLGWLQPVVVTESGFYSVPAAETSRLAYILYDPAHGTDEYFILENRWPAASAYESVMPDQGLAIWHITEFYDDEPFDFLKGRKMVAMKWAGGDGAMTTTPRSGLWDCSEAASCYDLTPLSTPRNSDWENGTDSGILLRQIPNAGSTVEVYIGIGAALDVAMAGPGRMALWQNVPNPARGRTTIQYELPAAGAVSLHVYDLAGRLVAELASGVQHAGRHRVEWSPQGLPSGVYYYRLRGGDSSLSRKLLLLDQP